MQVEEVRGGPPQPELEVEDEAREGPHLLEIRVKMHEGPVKPEVGVLARLASPTPEAGTCVVLSAGLLPSRL